jgi:pimeloyl-ACP methyl ester carboxylesterase
MPTLTRDGIEIWYESRGTGPALLLTHGFSATCEMWRGQVEAFARDWRVITWDVRGHGRSGSPEDPALYSEAACLGDMAAILDACGARRAVVGGLSLGGYLSLAFYVAHSERVRALCLFDTGPGYRDDAGRARWNQLAEDYARQFETRGLEALGGGAEVRLSTHRSAAGLARAARGILAQRDARVMDVLPKIDVPTLVLVGENDKPFLGASDYMAKKIPGAAKVVLAAAGHAANIDQPQAFNAAVRDFLEHLPAEPRA